MGRSGGILQMKYPLAILMIMGSLLISGCAVAVIGAAAAAGAGSVAYFKGELKAVEKGSVDRTYSSTLSALDRLGMFITKKEKDRTTAAVRGRRADDAKIAVFIKRLGDDVVQIRIRAGFLGDEGTSRQILEEIQKGL